MFKSREHALLPKRQVLGIYNEGYACFDTCPVSSHLIGTLVGAHLQADSGLVERVVHSDLRVKQEAPGSVGGHAFLAG